MSALEALEAARSAGVSVCIDGDGLVLEASAAPPPAVLDLLSRYKTGIVTLLRPAVGMPTGPADSTEAADWRERFEERAAIRQFEAGYPCDQAELLAFGECIEEWCKEHPAPADPLRSVRCGGCGKALADDVLDLADGARVHWERHREFACLINAGLRRKERAVAALAALGLAPPAGWEA